MKTTASSGGSRHAGVDVSKWRLDVCLLTEGASGSAVEAFSVSNEPAGIDSLVARLGEAAPELVVLEATGGYERAAAAAIAASGVPVAVVNPRKRQGQPVEAVRLSDAGDLAAAVLRVAERAEEATGEIAGA